MTDESYERWVEAAMNNEHLYNRDEWEDHYLTDPQDNFEYESYEHIMLCTCLDVFDFCRCGEDPRTVFPVTESPRGELLTSDESTGFSVHELLHLPLEDGSSLGELFGELLTALWVEGEGFSGKRPLGNSDWQWEVYSAMVKGGFITGTFDDEGYLDDCDTETADNLILEAIKLLTDHSG